MRGDWCFTRAPFKVVEHHGDNTMFERFWVVDASGYVHARYCMPEFAHSNANAWNTQAVKYRMGLTK